MYVTIVEPEVNFRDYYTFLATMFAHNFSYIHNPRVIDSINEMMRKLMPNSTIYTKL